MAEQLCKLPSPIADTLRCKQCKHYLSVLPIAFEEGSYKCGRCVINKTPLVRATAYEALAKVARFPCKYDSYGCRQFLNINETKDHEMKCEFKPITCPALKCTEEITAVTALNHFQETHREPIINAKTNQFSISFPKNTSTNFLLLLEGQLFLLETITNHHEICMRLRPLQDDVEALYQFEVKFGDSNTLTLSPQRVKKYCPEVSCVKDEIISFNCEMVKSENIRFEIKLLSGEELKTKKLGDLTGEFGCMVCKEYLRPPIYICKTGHNLCSVCKKRVKECPICKAKYEGGRNFAMEKITELAVFNCENQSKGCSFQGTLESVSEHKTKCPATVMGCPLNEPGHHCGWKGLLNQMYNHIQIAHPIQAKFKLNENVSRYLKSRLVQESYVVKYDKSLFKIRIEHNMTDFSVRFTVKHIGLAPTEKPMYQFILNFVDQTGTGRILSVNELCYSSQCKTDNNVALPRYLLKPFIIEESHKLIYSIVIALSKEG